MLDDRIELHQLPSLDLFNDHYPGRFPAYWELKTREDFIEVAQFSMGTFPEPLAFSCAGLRALTPRVGEFDLVHDNQCLGYGILLLERGSRRSSRCTTRSPTTAARDGQGAEPAQAWSVGRWYSFVRMQGRVASRMPRIVVVSENSISDIHTDMGVSLDRMRLVPVGVDAGVPAAAGRSQRSPAG